MQANLHEICSYDSSTAFYQPQPPTSTVTQAVVQMALRPAVSLKVSRVGTSKSGKIKLLGEVSILLGNEGYTTALPKLRMRQVNSSVWGMELAGELRTVNHTALTDLNGSATDAMMMECSLL